MGLPDFGRTAGERLLPRVAHPSLSHCTTNMWRRFNGFTLMVSQFLQGERGHTSCPVPCTCNCSQRSEWKTRCFGDNVIPRLIPGVGGQNMQCVIRAPGATRHLLNGLRDYLCSLKFSLETGDGQQASAIFEISAEYAQSVLWRSFHPRGLRKWL